MKLAEGYVYNIKYEDIDGVSNFTGEYRGVNNNKSLSFKNWVNGTTLIIGNIDIINIKENVK